MNSSSPASGKARTGILLILDGFGVNTDEKDNAIAQARTPNLDSLFKKYPHTTLEASEHDVGLPDGFMGNSEVGHLNIGAGRIVYQDFSLISKAISDGEFYTNPAFVELFTSLKAQKGKAALHLVGLVSDGGVHSHISHLYALLQLAKREGISKVWIHVITDGRDTPPTSAVEYVSALRDYCTELGVGKIATVQGRFFAMDRDNRWERTETAYRAMVQGLTEETYAEPISYVQSQYDRGTTDEFLPPARWEAYHGVQDGDGFIFFNFRADRARQLTRAFTQTEFPYFRRENPPTLSGFVTMTPYDASFTSPTAYQKPKVPATLGEIVSKLGWKQLRIAETEKYAHVTYFFNGGDERVFDGEKRVLIPSPRDVKTYDLKPEMSAAQVTESLLKEVQGGNYGFVVVNFANCDMVGHTGNLKAAISAVETIDDCLGKIVDWIETSGAFAILTSDHGNCERMVDEEGRPLTAHTMLPVPFVLIDPQRQEIELTAGGRLCDIAPTLLALWGVKQPIEMTGHSLLASR